MMPRNSSVLYAAPEDADRDPEAEKWEPACKPGSVVDSHSSGMHVTVHLERPTREPVRAARRDFRSLSNLRLSYCGTADASQIFRALSLKIGLLFASIARKICLGPAPSRRTRQLDRLLGRQFPYLILLRAGVYPAADVATDAVRSYHTISPLPTRRKRV